MYLYDDWRRVFVIRRVVTLGGRTVAQRNVERRTWMAPGEVKHYEYRLPLYRAPGVDSVDGGQHG
jgi:hypothetical protein